MEVHQHNHTPRKKWTHYFWEFLMLFLAVFCGFLAEYQLEHKIEKERGMKYIRSFYEDLKTDTANFSFIIQDYEIKEIAFKKIKECFDAMPLQIKSGNPCLADLVRNSERFSDLINTDRTLQQLKNAGGLRLLQEADADSVLVYDIMLRNYIRQETTGFQDIQNKMREIIYHMVSYKNLKSEKKDSSASFLYSANPELLNHFFVSLRYYSDYCLLNMQHIIEIKQKGIDLIKYFKNKYHFK